MDDKYYLLTRRIVFTDGTNDKKGVALQRVSPIVRGAR
jgi:hypothetical protein